MSNPLLSSLFSARLIIARYYVVCQTMKVYIMPKARTNIYITERQKKQLEKRSQDEDLPMAEIIRRALDAYLAWDDPDYRPTTPAPKKERRFHPHG